jgi:orotate phosphoribosyltransferase
LVAQELGLPFIYVRSKPKEHGTGSLIEGEIIEGQRVVVIEDLISTGKSSLQAVDALRAAGLSVAGLVAIFTYGFDKADENFANAKCRYSTLSNYQALINYAAEHSFIAQNEINLLNRWRENPAEWGTQVIES